MEVDKNILITGASSGLGAALALAYAERGVWLFLSGRNEKRLLEIGKQAKQKGAAVTIKPLDVTDADGMKNWVDEICRDHPLDLVIANAGISAGTGQGEESDEQNAAIFATNVQGVFNTIFPALPHMKKRERGQIAIMASLAGFRGIPGAPSYAASKAAVRVYGEGLRGDMSAYNVKVNIICPGFVQTPMTDVNNFKMPFLMSADKAALIIKKGLARNRSRIAFPWPMAALIWLIAALPISWTDWIFMRLPRKP